MKTLRSRALFFRPVLIFLLLSGLVLLGLTLRAQTTDLVRKTLTETPTSLFDLKTQTVVTKQAGRVEEGPNGKEYHFLYRVQARATASDAPKYLIDPKYSVTYTPKDFQEFDSVTLLSTNAETETDSPIWVYDVVYVGAGTRMIEFATTGAAEMPMFAVANNETNPGYYHCNICQHADASQCSAACRCCCFDGSTGCNCFGCQMQNPRCFSCPVGCTCSHCICDCDGCASQNPKCHVCPVGCTCSHCRCQCELSVDHTGRCGCTQCKKRDSTCPCACHSGCP